MAKLAGATLGTPTEFCVVWITLPTSTEATSLAHKLVQNKLVACANIIPGITSVYEWEGKVEESSEYMLMGKTRTALAEELTTFVKANHSYSCPEVITAQIHDGSSDYLNWILSNTKSPGNS